MKTLSKKALLLLIEGETDKSTFSVPFESFLDVYAPNIRPCFIELEDEYDPSGDLTSKKWVNKDNVISKMQAKFLLSNMKRNFMDEDDLVGIVHILDTDGVFIPDDKVIGCPEWSEAHKPIYCEDHIKARDSYFIKDLHNRRQESLDVLINTKKIRFGQRILPYSLFYCSCNLEHFLHGIRNNSPEEKKRLSRKFILEYGDDTDKFMDFMTNSPYVAKGMSYTESWEYIKKGLNSLSRFSNLNLLIEGIINHSLV